VGSLGSLSSFLKSFYLEHEPAATAQLACNMGDGKITAEESSILCT